MLVLATALVALDQLTKLWVVRSLPLGSQEIALALGFSLTHVRNNGAAFGMLRNFDLEVLGFHLDGTFMLGLLSGIVALGLLVYMLRGGARQPLLVRTALGMVLAGAVGNMIDRLRLGYVTDFIHFSSGSFSFPVFNVADMCVVIGAGLLVIASFARPTGAEGARVSTGVRAPHPTGLEDFPDLPPLGGRTTSAE
ncbi:MAG: signal peptidase II [Trueperaceae bacterium]|nr:signal peptidase II [Trueperaceae bacterium]